MLVFVTVILIRGFPCKLVPDTVEYLRYSNGLQIQKDAGKRIHYKYADAEIHISCNS